MVYTRPYRDAILIWSCFERAEVLATICHGGDSGGVGGRWHRRPNPRNVDRIGLDACARDDVRGVSLRSARLPLQDTPCDPQTLLAFHSLPNIFVYNLSPHITCTS